MLKRHSKRNDNHEPLINCANFNKYRENVLIGTQYGFHVLDITSVAREISSQIFFSHLFNQSHPSSQNADNGKSDEDYYDNDQPDDFEKIERPENMIDSFFQLSDSEETEHSPRVSLINSTHVSVASLMDAHGHGKTHGLQKNDKKHQNTAQNEKATEILASDVINWENCGGISIVEQFDRSNIFVLVGGGSLPAFKKNTLILWDNSTKQIIGSIEEKSDIKSVKIIANLIITQQASEIRVYKNDLKLLGNQQFEATGASCFDCALLAGFPALEKQKQTMAVDSFHCSEVIDSNVSGGLSTQYQLQVNNNKPIFEVNSNNTSRESNGDSYTSKINEKLNCGGKRWLVVCFPSSLTVGAVVIQIFDVTDAVADHFLRDINKREEDKPEFGEDVISPNGVIDEELLGSVEPVDPTTLESLDQKNNYSIEIHAHENPIKLISLSRDGTKLATCSDNGKLIKLFSVTNGGALLKTVRRGSSAANMTSMSFSNDGNYLVCASSNETIHVFNCKEGINGNANNNNYGGKSPSTVPQDLQDFPTTTSSILEYVHGYERAFFLYKGAAGKGQQVVCFGKKNNQILIATKNGFFFRIEFDEKGKILKEEFVDFSKNFLPNFVAFLDENTKKQKK